MKFKHRIWLLPIMTALIVTVGIAVNSQITTRTSAALVRVEKVQYPTVEALRQMRTDLTNVEDALQRAVAEGDQQSLASAEQHAAQVSKSLNALAALESDNGLDTRLSDAFENYYSAASEAVRIMLGAQNGNAADAIGRMQRNSEVLKSMLGEAQQAAIDEFRSLLARSTSNVERTLTVSLIMAAVMIIGLGFGSWVLIGSVFRILGGEPEAAVETVRSIAAGNFTNVVNLHHGDENSLLHSIETLRNKLGTVIRDVRRTSGTVDTAAADINSGVDRLSVRTADQAASLEETASSMEEMTATVKRNAENARHANQLATEARDRAEQGGSVAMRAVAAMSEINNSSKRIADIIGVIDGIAFQTNLLALNAAVEAARAGEQGRGFAVVASEVRNLAQRSATAAREIKELIADSVTKVQDGSKLVDESGKHLNDIVAAAKKVADIIGEISSASSQQATGLDQVNATIMQMDEMTQQNASMAQETSSVSSSMKDQARQLTELIAVFKVEDGGTPTTPSYTPQPARTTSLPTKKRPAARTSSVSAASTSPVQKVAGSDVEWQEF